MSQMQNKKIITNCALLLLVVLNLFVILVGCRHHCNVDINHVSSQDSNLTAEVDKVKYLSFRELGCPDMNDGLLLERKAYVASYNSETLIPNWVAWVLTGEHADGPWPRDHHYYEDVSVPEPHPTNDDYYGIGSVGLSHGHMCPAGDCKWDSVAMAETNLLTNICPQESGLNSGMWNQIEQACRRWAVKYGRIYIVCGPLLYRQEHLTIGDNNVVVPEAFFKVILRLGDDPACIGYVMKNGSRGKKKSYVNTLSQVERITGYYFFPNLNDSIRNQIEDIADENMW